MKQNLWFHKYALKFLQTSSAMAILFTSAIALASPPGDGWQLKFNDDFNSDSLDSSKWSPCYWWADSKGCTNGSAGDLQWFQSDQVLVQNGTLRIRAEKRQSNGKEYTSGMISSHDKFSFKYGYVEMRAKIPGDVVEMLTQFKLISQTRIG